MANTTSAYGLKPVASAWGAGIRVNPYYAPNSLASLGLYTPVIRAGSANSASVINGQVYPAGTLATIAVASSGDGNKLTGSIVGFEAVPTNIFLAGYNTASTARIVYVADHPDQLFTIIDDASATLAVTDVGLNANLVVGTVNATTGLDSTTLNASTVANTATFQLKILRLVNSAINELGTGAEWLVKINNHTDANITQGV